MYSRCSKTTYVCVCMCMYVYMYVRMCARMHEFSPQALKKTRHPHHPQRQRKRLAQSCPLPVSDNGNLFDVYSTIIAVFQCTYVYVCAIAIVELSPVLHMQITTTYVREALH